LLDKNEDEIHIDEIIESSREAFWKGDTAEAKNVSQKQLRRD
jgi:hypothetical protein